MFVVNDFRFFLSHRMRIAYAAQDMGYNVCIACPDDPGLGDLEQQGFTVIPIKLRRGSRSLWVELNNFLYVWNAVKKFKPDVLHLITSKPIIYGGLVARILKIPSLSAISGLGYVFTGSTLSQRIMRLAVTKAYGWSVNRSNSHVLFQNMDDLEIFNRAGLLSDAKSSILPGSGVDLSKIYPTPLPEGVPIVLMPSRMLRDKGVLEFVSAARMLHSQGINAVFRLLGDPDPLNPTSLTKKELEEFAESASIEWYPYTKDISSALSQAHLVVLPSYREGFPKALIDAAAAGRAIATTDVPGCRDAISPGETGELFNVKDVTGMANTIKNMLDDRCMLEEMGRLARRRAEDKFDIDYIINEHLKIYLDLASKIENC